MFELFRQFVRFAGVGCMSAVGHYGLLILLVQFVHADAVASSAAGAFLGAIINYTLNYHFTFRSTKCHQESIVKFAVIALFGLALNTLLMWIGVDVLHWHYLVTQLLTTVLVMIWSFLGHRFWTFHAPTQPAE